MRVMANSRLTTPIKELKKLPSIGILVGAFNQDFPLTCMIRLADNAFLLHAFH